MRKNNVNFAKLNNKHYPKYYLPFGFGFVCNAHFGKPGYLNNFKNKFYKNSKLLLLLDYGISGINRLIRDNKYASLPCSTYIPIKA